MVNWTAAQEPGRGTIVSRAILRRRRLPSGLGPGCAGAYGHRGRCVSALLAGRAASLVHRVKQLQQTSGGRYECGIRRDHRGSALRGFADGDAPGPEGIPCARGRPRDVPERHGVLARRASAGRRRPRTVGTARSADGDRMSADSHLRLRFRSLHDLRVAGHRRRAGRVLRQADGARQTARRRSG